MTCQCKLCLPTLDVSGRPFEVELEWPDSWQADTTKSVIFRWRGEVVRSEVALSVFRDSEAAVTKPGV